LDSNRSTVLNEFNSVIYILQMYLSQFGYLSPSMKNPNSGHIMSEETMARALMDFQSFAGLNLTGECVISPDSFCCYYLEIGTNVSEPEK